MIQVAIIIIAQFILKFTCTIKLLSITMHKSLFKQSIWKAVTKPQAQSRWFRQTIRQKLTLPLK